VIRTGAMANDAPHALLLSGLQDQAGNALPGPITAGFTSPPVFQPFQPIVDTVPPAVSSVRPTSPTEIEVTFTERLAEGSVVAAGFSIARAGGGAAPSIVSLRLASGGTRVLLTTTAQERQVDYGMTISGVRDLAGNSMVQTAVPFSGFGEFDPPEIARIFPLSSTRVALLWNEPVTAASAGRVTSYTIPEATVTAVRFGASEELRNAAFNATFAPLRADVVILTTTPLVAGAAYTVRAEGVSDLSGNESQAQANFTAVAQPPTVTVLLTYLVSDTAQVLGVGAGGAPGVPGRAISPGTLAQQREGIFALGTALNEAGSAPLVDHPFTTTLRGFPPEGAPLDGVEPQLRDDGTNGDRVAGDNIYTIRIADVPVGSTVAWKAFASFTTTFAAANPGFPGASFADAQPGPSVFADGQEYPGNDNAVFILGDADGDGVVEIANLFGDEITFKRKTGFPAFHMAIDRARRLE
jgi:hypothetical protein